MHDHLVTVSPDGRPARAGGERLSAAFDALLDAFWLLETVRGPGGAVVDFRVTDLNLRAATTVEVQRDSARGALLSALVPSARRLGHFETYARVAETGIPETIEFRFDAEDAPPVWREVQAVRVGDGVALTLRDITQRVVLEQARLASDRDFRLLAENASDMILRITPDGIVTYVSPACREILGYEPHEMIGRPAIAVVHPDDEAAVRDMGADLEGGAVLRSPVYRARRKDGGWVWLESACRGVTDGRGGLSEVQVSTRDVSERAMADAEHVALNRVAEAVATGTSGRELHELVAVEVARLLGAEGGRVVRYLGAGEAVLLGAWRRDGLPPVRAGERIALQGTWAIAETSRTGATSVSELTVEDAVRAGANLRVGLAAPVRLGTELWGAVAAAFVEPADVPPGAVERVERFAKLIELAIANADARDRLTAQATTDGLTGLANHATFHTALIDAFALAERHGRPLGLAIIDLDHFKSVNDTLGHRAGDAALRIVADILRRHARRSDVVGRIGGEEMAWVMPETSVGDAAQAAERLRLAIAAAPIAAPLGLTASIGVTGRMATDTSPEAVFRRADAALYRSKDLGRNRVLVD